MGEPDLRRLMPRRLLMTARFGRDHELISEIKTLTPAEAAGLLWARTCGSVALFAIWATVHYRAIRFAAEPVNELLSPHRVRKKLHIF